MDKSADLNTAFQAFDACTGTPSPSLALISLWGALERLFSPSPAELRFRVATAIAAFLERPGPERLARFRSVLDLYNERSKAAHGTPVEGKEALVTTRELMKLVLIRIIEIDRVPVRADLDGLICGVEFPQHAEGE